MILRTGNLSRAGSALAGLLLAVLALPTVGAEREAGSAGWKEQRVMSSRTFLDAHPDMKHRYEGWFAYEAGDYAAAMQSFKRAAGYADKASQAMIAEMLWQGRGVVADRAMAYAWADLSAERGYVQFVRLREQYWRRLDDGERARAMREGPALLPVYGDTAAKPRMSAFMVKARRAMRSSSMSAGPPQQVYVPGPTDRPVRIDGHLFFDPKFWDPVKYQAWQDTIWADPPQGKVDVGEPEQVAPISQ